ncbi:MAG TPA: YCF48-related protein [Acidobacteriaceae bacterium]
MSVTCVGAALAAPSAIYGQWDMQDSGVKESLRGVSWVGGGVAWASGTHGTVLRTEDGGYVWQRCGRPDGAEELDFRGVVGFDANTALVMSSGKGALSRLYKTTDGGSSWKLLATNSDAEGFWDALAAAGPTDQKRLVILGDPVGGRFVVRSSEDGGTTWKNEEVDAAFKDEGAFAASNSSLVMVGKAGFFVTGGPEGARLYTLSEKRWVARAMPEFAKGESAGIFSIAAADATHLVAVGGDYKKADAAVENAAWSEDGGKTWGAASRRPEGYRSAVAYDLKEKVWIAVGPSGTDISRDGGKNWVPIKPGAGESADTDTEWNALSMPFVVGSKGRVGKWRGDVAKR